MDLDTTLRLEFTYKLLGSLNLYPLLYYFYEARKRRYKIVKKDHRMINNMGLSFVYLRVSFETLFHTE
jgi:hypothetical protein